MCTGLSGERVYNESLYISEKKPVWNSLGLDNVQIWENGFTAKVVWQLVHIELEKDMPYVHFIIWNGFVISLFVM